MNTVPRLDIMVAYSCNLACKGCISLSDWPRNGVEPRQNILTYIDYWKKLIEPEVVTIFGGEPTLHPELQGVCTDIREAWPSSIIRLITNGYLLDNFDPNFWFTLGKFEIQISIHRKDHEQLINKHIRQILIQRTDWTIQKNNSLDHRQIEWQSDHVRVYKSIFKDFIIPFQSQDQTIDFWHSDPAQAHKICGAPNTPILYKGKLYKCPAVANVIDLTGKNPFNYTPCADESTLTEFISNIGKPEAVCAQCPDSSQAQIINHFDKNNVVVKQKISN